MKNAHAAKTMHYGKAIKILKNKAGAKVARKEWMETISGGKLKFEDWYEKGPCLILVSDWTIIHENNKLKDFEIKEHKPFIGYKTRTGCLVPYVATKDDELAEDWIEV